MAVKVEVSTLQDTVIPILKKYLVEDSKVSECQKAYKKAAADYTASTNTRAKLLNSLTSSMPSGTRLVQIGNKTLLVTKVMGYPPDIQVFDSAETLIEEEEK